MKHSYQREAILKIVMDSCDHPTAEMIYNRSKETIPNISLGTVYRNLNQLSELGLIKRIVMPNISDRFDKTIENHAHFYCIKCNETFDIMEDKFKDLDSEVSKRTGNTVLSHDIVFVGICKKHL